MYPLISLDCLNIINNNINGFLNIINNTENLRWNEKMCSYIFEMKSKPNIRDHLQPVPRFWSQFSNCNDFYQNFSFLLLVQYHCSRILNCIKLLKKSLYWAYTRLKKNELLPPRITPKMFYENNKINPK